MPKRSKPREPASGCQDGRIASDEGAADGRRRRQGPAVEAEGLRGGAVPAAGRAGAHAGVGAAAGHPARGGVRGQGRGRQGQRDQAGHGVPQHARRADRRAAGADRARAHPVVLPALRRAASRGRRDRPVRPQLVQPGRRRVGDGLLHQAGAPALPAPVPDLRATAHRGRHPAAEVLVLGQRRRAGAPVRLPAGRPDAAMEAVADGLRVDQPVGGLLPREGRDVRPHRPARGALARRGGRGQAQRAGQHDRPPALDRPLRRGPATVAGPAGAAAVEGIRADAAGDADLRARPRRHPAAERRETAKRERSTPR